MSELIGHFHVVLVHLPIGILLIACLFQWLESSPRFSSLYTAANVAFLLGMFFAILSAVTGYLLSLGGDYDEGLVSTHQWFGISVALVSVCMYFLHSRQTPARLQTSVSVLLVLLIIITGHLGGSITHGSDYLTKSLNTRADTATVQRKPIANVQEAVAYSDIIKPLLQTKCYSCHGKNKQKGKLRMDDSLRLMKGGKDGRVILPGNADKSEMFKRISLPREDDDHMPPKEKSQLSPQEIDLIHWWIANGASFGKKVNQLNQPDDIKPALLALQKSPEKKITAPELPSAPVAKADERNIKKLQDLGAVVEPVAQNTNYLSANFVTVPDFADGDVQLLLPLSQQLVELKMANTSITDSAVSVISHFRNLMHLELDHTKITDKGLTALRSLQNLRYLNLIGTGVTAGGVMQLKNLKDLQSVYLYQTAVKNSDWSNLKKAFPKTWIDSGGYTVPFLATDTTEVKPPKTIKQ